MTRLKKRRFVSSDTRSNDATPIPILTNGVSNMHVNGNARPDPRQVKWRQSQATSASAFGMNRASAAKNTSTSGRQPPQPRLQRNTQQQSRGYAHQRSNSFKRRMEEPLPDPRPARRMRTENNEPYMDEEYIVNNMSMPTRADYAKAPRYLFESDSVNALKNASQKWNMELNEKFVQLGSTHCCKLNLTLADGTSFNVNGYGVTPKSAKRAAFLHCMSQLHTSGTLQQILTADNMGSLNLSRQTLQEENDSVHEVYNYCARFGLLPRVELKSAKTLSAAGRKKGWEAAISLPKHGINVRYQSGNSQHALIAASVQFKQAAEQYYAEQGDSSLVIRDQNALTTDNVKNFWDYLKLQKHSPHIKVEAGPYHGHGSNLWLAQAYVMKSAPSNPFLDALRTAQPSTPEWTKLGDSVLVANKKKAEELANLVAAVKLCQEDSELMNGFQRSMAEGSGTILTPVAPVKLDVNYNVGLALSDTVRAATRSGLLRDSKDVLSEDDDVAEHLHQNQRMLSRAEIDAKSARLKTQLERFQKDEQLEQLRAQRASLPMSQYCEQVLQQIDNHTYSVIVGATGSGKTTQVPQIVLDDAIGKRRGASCNVICTQPRRIAATSVARRVAEERREALQNTVGYHVRFDPKRPALGGSINYCTTGILLQQLQNSPDETLDRISHIIIDEVHERDILIDFLMIIVKDALRRRTSQGKSVPKVVLMSATIDSDLFAQYFEETMPDGTVLECPSLSVPGRTFPVTDKYLGDLLTDMKARHGVKMKDFLASDLDTKDYLDFESQFEAEWKASGKTADGPSGSVAGLIDWKRERRITADGEEGSEREDGLVPINLVAATIMHICQVSEDGAILAFLPGYDEMKKTNERLIGMQSLGYDVLDESKYRIHMLHSSVPGGEQSKVFDKMPPGCRKIILSTNIAETSVTIPDVQYVVDTGKLREKRYDQVRRITKLQCTWISKSNAKQRAGRAGRVQNGHYYALYSKDRFDSLRAIGLPEMLRSDLQEICLDIKAQRFRTPIREFLSQAIEPPPPSAVDASVLNLQALQALTDDEGLTALGRLLAKLPVHPALGKMILLGVIFRCLDPMIILGSTISERSLFLNPPERRREAQEKHAQWVEGTQSDHYALISAFIHLRRLRQTQGNRTATMFAHDNFLHMGSFKVIDGTAKQIEEVLVSAGLIPKVDERDRVDHQYGHPTLNQNSTNVDIIKAIALGGLHPNLAVATGKVTFRTPGERNAMVHPSSMNHPRGNTGYNQHTPGTLFTYSTMAKSNDGKSTFLRDTTLSTPLMATMFGGRLTREGGFLRMDEWLPFVVRGSSRGAGEIVNFRQTLDRMLTRSFAELASFRGRAGGNGRGTGASQAQSYLADDELRDIFARGIREVLLADAGRRRNAEERGDGRDGESWRSGRK